MSEGLQHKAIETVAQMAQDSRRATFHKCDAEPQDVYFVETKDGDIMREVAESLAHHKLDTPEELARFAAENKTDVSQIFYHNQLIHFLFNHDRREWAICSLPYAAQWRWLTDRAGNTLSQSEFYRTLRITFRECVSPQLLSSVKNLRWSNGSETSGQIQHGAESLGRTITAKVNSEEAIPEEVTLTVPIWENFGHRVRIACAIEIFPREHQFTLTPYPLELQRGLDEGLAAIAEVLSAADIPTYRGEA